MAVYVDELCAAGHTGWSIRGAGLLPGDAAMAAALQPQDCLYTLIVRDHEHTSARVVGSLVEYVHAHPDPEELVCSIAAADTRVVSLTITEGGYPVNDESGRYDPSAAATGPGSAFGVLVAGLQRRRRLGLPPITVVSCDNLVANGDAARAATIGQSTAVDPSLGEWIDTHIAFPNSMVDRITPSTTDHDRRWLAHSCGVADNWPVVAEPFRQWVIEDRFAAERPPLEDVGVTITDDVTPFEMMKLRMLNASHSALAYLAALVGHDDVAEVMGEPRFCAYVRAFLDREAAPVLPPAPGIDLADYSRSLIDRFSNTGVADQVARLCLDGSAKIPKFLLPTLRAQLAVDGDIALTTLAVAGWCVYLRGRAEDGSVIALADDPNLADVRDRAHRAASDPRALLQYPTVFGDDLPDNPRFASTFAATLTSLQTAGVRSTIDAILSGKTMGHE